MKFSYWIALKSIWIKEINRLLRIWMQTLIPPVITMSLYFLIFGKLIGSRVGMICGISYIEFIAPGLIMMSLIANSYSNVSSSFFSAKFQRNIDELIIAPVPTYIIIIGYIGGGIVRGICVGFLVMLVSLFFGTLHIYSGIIILITSLLTVIIFSLAGLLNALFAKKFDDISIIPTFILTPLTYLGGVFYLLSLLPPFWQLVSKFNPILYVINGFHYGFLGIEDVPISYTIFVLVLCVIILYFLIWFFINKKKLLIN